MRWSWTCGATWAAWSARAWRPHASSSKASPYTHCSKAMLAVVAVMTPVLLHLCFTAWLSLGISARAAVVCQ